jgi:hypothetical protein
MDTLSPRRIAQETNGLAPFATATLRRRIVHQGRSRRYGVVLQCRCEGTTAPSPDPVRGGRYRGLLLLSHSPTFLVQTIGFQSRSRISHGV